MHQYRYLPWVLSAIAAMEATKLVFIEVIHGDNCLLGLPAMGPAIDVAFDDANMMYPDMMQNYTRKHFYVPGNFSCLDASITMREQLGHIMQYLATTDGFRVLISPGCILVSALLQSLDLRVVA